MQLPYVISMVFKIWSLKDIFQICLHNEKKRRRSREKQLQLFVLISKLNSEKVKTCLDLFLKNAFFENSRFKTELVVSELLNLLVLVLLSSSANINNTQTSIP